MRKRAIPCAALALAALSFYGCDETNPTEPTQAVAADDGSPLFGARGNQPFDVEGGAIVYNGGEGKPRLNCRWGSYITHEGSVVVTPSGNWKIDCQFKDVPDYWEHRIVRNWLCTLCVPGQGCERSYNSLWVQTGNNGHSYCHFNGKMRWGG